VILLEDFKPRVINMIFISTYICVCTLRTSCEGPSFRCWCFAPYFSRLLGFCIAQKCSQGFGRLKTRGRHVFFVPPIFDVQICPKNPSFPERGLSSSQAWWWRQVWSWIYPTPGGPEPLWIAVRCFCCLEKTPHFWGVPGFLGHLMPESEYFLD